MEVIEPKMEFFEILNLPEEDIVNVCSQMDDITLAKFLGSSKEAKRICNEVATKREISYKALADKLLNEAMRKSSEPVFKFIYLPSDLNDREFYLTYFTFGSDFILEELLFDEVYILQRLFPEQMTRPSIGRRFSRSNMKDLLVKMMKLRYISGNEADYQLQSAKLF